MLKIRSRPERISCSPSETLWLIAPTGCSRACGVKLASRSAAVTKRAQTSKMSGSVRSVQNGALLRKHDHVEWQFERATLRLHDPRRFGAVLWHPVEDGPVEQHALLRGLGKGEADIARLRAGKVVA